MKRTIIRMLAIAAVASAGLSGVANAGGCGSGRGGYSYGYGLARPATGLYQPAPIYRPTYDRPIYPRYRVTNVPGSVRPISSASVLPRPPQRAAIPANTLPLAGQAAAPTQAVSGSAQPAAGSSALAALASIAATPTTASPAATGSTATAPAAATSNGVPQFGAAPATTTAPAAHVGTWLTQLPSGISIGLKLNQDGTFAWAVQNNGKSTQFAGRYTITNGRLTLVRNNDQQQMAGSWTTNGTGFTFQLDGSNNAGLKFQKG